MSNITGIRVEIKTPRSVSRVIEANSFDLSNFIFHPSLIIIGR
jgi:hypothetical protein